MNTEQLFANNAVNRGFALAVYVGLKRRLYSHKTNSSAPVSFKLAAKSQSEREPLIKWAGQRSHRAAAVAVAAA